VSETNLTQNNLPSADQLYVALLSDGHRVGSLRRLQYRCHSFSRCLLLDAVAVSGTILLHQKRFKQSEQVNRQRSSEAGRRANAYDGATHWKPRTFFIDQSALAHPDDIPTPRLPVQCDHVGVLPDGGAVTLSATGFHADWNAGHREVIFRSDGSRYAR
jgi:hypothetical protein